MKQIKEPSMHKKLITFFSDTTLAVRGFRPAISPKDAQNLKRVIDLDIISQTRFEQLMLYFIADKNYRNLGPSIATMLSATVLNSLRDRAINRNQFYKELEEYTTRYLNNQQSKRQELDDDAIHEPVSISSIIGKLLSKLSFVTGNQPRAPVKTSEGAKGRNIRNLSLF